MDRKFKNVAKRIFGAYDFRDHGKFEKYEQRLDFVAEELEVRIHVVVELPCPADNG
jgi:hypothetical protein